MKCVHEMCPRRWLESKMMLINCTQQYTKKVDPHSIPGGRVTIILWVTKMTVRMMSDLVKSSHLVWFRMSMFSDKHAGTSKGHDSSLVHRIKMRLHEMGSHLHSLSRGQEVVMVADGDGRSSIRLLMNRRRTSIPTREKIYEILRITPIQLNSYHPVHSNPYYY